MKNTRQLPRFSAERAGIAVAAAAALGVTGAPAAAQTIAGSESNVALAQDAHGGGGPAVATAGSLEGALPHLAAGPVASSETFQLVPSVVWVEPVLGSSAPLLFSVTPPAAAATGGDTLTLRGLNFTAPGAGATNVTIASALVGDVVVLGPTEIRVTAPTGVDLDGNPLGGVGVTVANDLGTVAAAHDFQYLPAIFLLSPAEVGDPLSVRMRTLPGSVGLVWYGQSLTGKPKFTVPGVAGAGLVMPTPFLIVPPTFLPSGDLSVPLQVPNDPAVAGALVEFQGFAATGAMATADSFTNILTIQVQQ